MKNKKLRFDLVYKNDLKLVQSENLATSYPLVFNNSVVHHNSFSLYNDYKV